MRILLLFIFLYSFKASAYPDFISYGYNTCISCHFNSHGNGPLTDYGRALFSQEIAARNLWTPKSVSDDTIAEKSGFIPGVELPFWVRPGLKYRGLWIQTGPGSATKNERWIRMQRDLNLVLSADRDYRTVLVLNYGLLHEGDQDYYGNEKPVDWVSREHYLRFFPLKKLLVSVGLMDIAYGLRTGDHTSVSRGALGLGQEDQVHGVLLQWFEREWDFTIHGFSGNLLREESAQRKGFSVQSEFMLFENNKFGFSYMQADTSALKTQRLALHNRLGLPRAPGSSLLAEIGLKRNKSVSQSAAQDGAYAMLQAIVHIRRGYNIISVIERNHNELKSSATETSRWTLGLLMFPLQRTEFRLTMVQGKIYSPTTSAKDSTQLQGQIHVSW